MQHTDSSKDNSGEDHQGNSCVASWRLEVQSDTLPPNPSLANPSSVNSSRTVSKQYRQICPTHRRLVKSGSVKCSVSLSDTPPITVDNPHYPVVDLPSAPNSPDPTAEHHQGSVHWGAVGEHSGVQTPADSPLRDISVINLAPPPLPPRRPPTVILPVPPPKHKLVSPALVQGVSALLEQLPTYTADLETPLRPSVPQPSRRASWKIPIVSTDISSLDSFPPVNISPTRANQRHPEVFSPIPQEVSPANHAMDEFSKEQDDLNEMRERLYREMEDLEPGDMILAGFL